MWSMSLDPAHTMVLLMETEVGLNAVVSTYSWGRDGRDSVASSNGRSAQAWGQTRGNVQTMR